ncbi:hypothetical protein scyTo_0000877 [Scyliorhinus torazame]|uniref:Uncharacterized protein n=1 Tax=Scyliorhinus torazame TaxID=75743 RepID=A0A401P5K7_SCYTO|nr:hypothetical protein [Scyliorhinus torazame]
MTGESQRVSDRVQGTERGWDVRQAAIEPEICSNYGRGMMLIRKAQIYQNMTFWAKSSAPLGRLWAHQEAD